MQSVQLSAMTGRPSIPEGRTGARPFDPDAVTLRPLRTAREIASVLHLRDEIDLSVHTGAGRPDFHSLEKKETNAASSWHSTSKANA
jgi:hypothetical protein